MQCLVRGQYFALSNRLVASGKIAHKAACFANHQNTGSHIPNVKPRFPKSVKTTRSQPGKVKRRCAIAADTRHLRRDRTKNTRPFAKFTMPCRRNTGGNKRLRQIPPRRYPQALVAQISTPVQFCPPSLV